MNYTKEIAVLMCKEYTAKPCRETVNKLAVELGKSEKSIIGKLSREGVYRREVYKTKLGETPVTKIELVHHIAEHLELEPDSLTGLDKTPKNVLKIVNETLQRGLNTSQSGVLRTTQVCNGVSTGLKEAY